MLRYASLSEQFSRELTFFKLDLWGAVSRYSREIWVGLQLFPVSSTSQTGVILENADAYVEFFIIFFAPRWLGCFTRNTDQNTNAYVGIKVRDSLLLIMIRVFIVSFWGFTFAVTRIPLKDVLTC